MVQLHWCPGRMLPSWCMAAVAGTTRRRSALWHKCCARSVFAPCAGQSGRHVKQPSPHHWLSLLLVLHRQALPAHRKGVADHGTPFQHAPCAFWRSNAARESTRFSPVLGLRAPGWAFGSGCVPFSGLAERAFFFFSFHQPLFFRLPHRSFCSSREPLSSMRTFSLRCMSIVWPVPILLFTLTTCPSGATAGKKTHCGPTCWR